MEMSIFGSSVWVHLQHLSTLNFSYDLFYLGTEGWMSKRSKVWGLKRLERFQIIVTDFLICMAVSLTVQHSSFKSNHTQDHFLLNLVMHWNTFWKNKSVKCAHEMCVVLRI